MLGATGDSSANFTNNDTRDQNASARGSISDYDKRVNAFNKKRPLPAGKGGWGNRVTSWSDPISARNILLDEDEVRDHDGSSSSSHSGTRARAWSRVWRDSFGADGEEVGVTVSGDEGAGDVERRRRLFRHCARRRHSFHDLSSFDYVRVLSPERMRIDVALSGQLLVMLRREEHLENVLACLEVYIHNFLFLSDFMCLSRPSLPHCPPLMRRYAKITSPTRKDCTILEPAPRQ